jgi:hypothetical protein
MDIATLLLIMALSGEPINITPIPEPTPIIIEIGEPEDTRPACYPPVWPGWNSGSDMPGGPWAGGISWPDSGNAGSNA